MATASGVFGERPQTAFRLWETHFVSPNGCLLVSHLSSSVQEPPIRLGLGKQLLHGSTASEGRPEAAPRPESVVLRVRHYYIVGKVTSRGISERDDRYPKDARTKCERADAERRRTTSEKRTTPEESASSRPSSTTVNREPDVRGRARAAVIGPWS